MPGNNPGTQNPQIAFSQPGQTAQQANQPAYGINQTFAQKIQNMYKEQNNFPLNGKQKFTLQIYGQSTPTKFVAHLGPNDVSYSQVKRTAALDALSGVVIQDFGYRPQTLEIRGTTGSAYYQEIDEMDAIFNSQNLGNPLPVTVTLEYTTYQALWQEFKYGRAINATAGNLINYQMVFTILQIGLNFSNGGTSTVTQGSPQAQSNATQNQSVYVTGKGQTADISATGQTIKTYLINTDPNVGPSNYTAALNFVQNSWNSKKYGPYPGPNKTLNNNQKITIPVPWSTVLGNSVTSGLGDYITPLRDLS